jgi:hypothetical protein
VVSIPEQQWMLVVEEMQILVVVVVMQQQVLVLKLSRMLAAIQELVLTVEQQDKPFEEQQLTPVP